MLCIFFYCFTIFIKTLCHIKAVIEIQEHYTNGTFTSQNFICQKIKPKLITLTTSVIQKLVLICFN